MITFAEIVLHPGGIIAWFVMGLLGGWLARWSSMRPGYGILIDLVVGLLGAALGGFVFWILVSGDIGFWGSLPAAFGGAFLAAFGARFFAAEPKVSSQKPSARNRRSWP